MKNTDWHLSHFDYCLEPEIVDEITENIDKVFSFTV